MICTCNTPKYDARYGCPEEICPGCFDSKPHDDRHCSECWCIANHCDDCKEAS